MIGYVPTPSDKFELTVRELGYSFSVSFSRLNVAIEMYLVPGARAFLIEVNPEKSLKARIYLVLFFLVSYNCKFIAIF